MTKLFYTLTLLFLSGMTGPTMNAQMFAKRHSSHAVRTTSSPMKRTQGTATVQRLQPSKSEVVDVYSSDPYLKEYDAYGNETKIDKASIIYYYNYDHSKGYPFLLDEYYEDFSGAEKQTRINRKTTMADGIRTAIQLEHSETVTLDAAGHVTDYVNAETHQHISQTWDGDRLVSNDYSEINPEKGINWTMSYRNIHILHARNPFNAFCVDYNDYLEDCMQEEGIVFEANGLYNEEDSEEGESLNGDLSVVATVSNDKRNIIVYTKVGDLLMRKEEKNYTDDYGSYQYTVHYNSEDGRMWQETMTFNQYGDCTNEHEIYEDESEHNYRYEWTYDESIGKPLSVKEYREYNNKPESLTSTEIFTDWYPAGTGIETNKEGDATVLGGTLYTLSGTFVCNLTADEAQAVVIPTPAGRGVYLLAVHTDKGVWVRKVIK